ncbi:MAG TPA: hypothetical protein GXX75_07790 [Clostridiales bacterium]|nr:hypothetical protein [Clostridiales bacterium]
MLEVLNETDCSYQSFVATIVEMVKAKMGEDYTVQVYKVIKNNSLELDSLILLMEGRSFAPNIYLQPYYEAYLDGISMEEIADRLCCVYRDCPPPVTGGDFDYTFEAVKKNIVYRLINYEKNQKLLEKVPYLQFLDFAITFHCLVHYGQDGIGTIRITNEHISHWKVSLEELKELAAENTRNQFPPMIRSMDEVLRRMMDDSDGQDGEKEVFRKTSLEAPREASMDEILDELVRNKEGSKKMYILTNSQGINGATCLLYGDILKNFSNHLKSDLFILPSSIHEIILVPDDCSVSKERLRDMVIDVNQNQVAKEEVLSDQVYYYSREKDAISFA